MQTFEMGYALSSKGSVLEAVCVCFLVLQARGLYSGQVALLVT